MSKLRFIKFKFPFVSKPFHGFLASHLYINLACLSVCLFVCLYPINAKTAEPIGSKFCVGPDVVPGKVYEWSKLKKLASNKIRFSQNFENPRFFFIKSAKFFFFVLKCTQREHVHNGNGR